MNSDGQLAIGDVVPPLEHSPVMSLVPASADEIAMALRHGCVVDADTLVCWGRTPKPGGVPSPAIPTPTIVPFDMAILSHRTSPAHTCVLTENLEIWCWGRGDSGQLGNGSLESLEWPTRTFTDFEIGELAAVNPATCVRDLSGGTYCVGRNHRGQFGNGMIDDEPVVDPQASPALDGLQLVGGPGSHACGLAIDGTLSCWGFNQQGQVGDGSTELRATPVEIGDAQQWMAVATGMVHTCAIDIDGRLWCWGSNSEGQVGDGSDDMLVPLPSQVGS